MTKKDLYDAIVHGDVEKASAIIDSNGRLLTETHDWLHDAASYGQLGIVRLLLSRGIDLNREVSLSGTPLDSAASKGQLEVVRFLVENGAHLKVPRPDRNPLFSAIYGGHAEVAQFLLEAGMDPHVVYRGVNGKLANALSFAQKRGQARIVDLLLKAGCRLPVEGVDQPVWEPEECRKKKTKKEAPPSALDQAHEQIIAHMTRVFGPVEPLAFREIVPVHESVHVAVHVIRPNDDHPVLTLFTTGMSDRPMKVPCGHKDFQYAELVMHLPGDWRISPGEKMTQEWYWPVQRLRQVAYYPHLNDTWLGGPHTIFTPQDPPVPLGPQTHESCLLLFADTAEWSPVKLDNGKNVHFYSVTTLFKEERDFEKQNGLIPLLQRLEQHGCLTIAAVPRPNVAL